MKYSRLLEKHGVTAYKVSKATGISTATLSDPKNGKSYPKNDKIQILEDYFNVLLEYLTTGRSFISDTHKSDYSCKRSTISLKI